MALYFLIIALSIIVFVTLWYLYGQKLGRIDVADEAWGLAQPYIVLIAIFAVGNYSLSSVVLLLITFIWGYRLFAHLHKRHAMSPAEDIRYTEMKAGWKKFPKLKAYTYVFLFQGLLMFILGMASMFLVFSKSDWNSLSLIGLAVWVIGYFFEATADKQLKEFVSDTNNKGKIMDKGLWKYSRHPNYFGEVIMWWGVFLFVLANTGIVWAIITPLIITYLIVFVSGIPLTEKHFESNPLWKDYKKKTSALIPLPNKR